MLKSTVELFIKMFSFVTILIASESDINEGLPLPTITKATVIPDHKVPVGTKKKKLLNKNAKYI